jgi:Tol biopolymer transport system component
MLVRTGDIRGISFAPSGDALAYARDSGRTGTDYRPDIFSVRIANGRISRLTGDGHSGEPVWGPTSIAYRHYVRTTWPQVGGTWLMWRDGSGKHPFARGDQNRRHAHYGLMPVEFSRDGKRLLACTVAEFGCSPVTFFVATKQRHAFSVGEFPRHTHGLLAPEDMSGDGRSLLVWIGSVDGAAADDIYAVPFAGGKARLVAHNADWAGWRD